jgi:hypothetical protein
VGSSETPTGGLGWYYATRLPPELVEREGAALGRLEHDRHSERLGYSQKVGVNTRSIGVHHQGLPKISSGIDDVPTTSTRVQTLEAAVVKQRS